MAARGGRRAFAGKQQTQEEPGTVHPSIIKQARKSGQLNISGRSLTTVPDAVWRINIDVPDEGKTASMENADDRWWEQTDLVKLIAASNWLTSLSEDISQLPALTVLDVHDNRLEKLPEALGSVENLQKLDVGHNRLSVLPACIGNLRNLKVLHMSHNELTELGDTLGNLIYLEDLELSNNQLTSLPPAIGYLCNVMKLNVSNNKLQTVPPEIGTMNALRQFDATHNELTDLPSQFGSLLKLEQVYLRHNRISHIPALTDCNSLKLPYILGAIESLKSIVLDGNPMKSIRRDIVQRGTQEIKKYLRSRIDDSSVLQNGAKNVIQSSKGQSGVIGGTGDGVNAHDVCQFKNLDYSNKKCSEVPGEVWQVAAKGEVTSVNLSKNCFSQLPQGLMLVSDFLKELNLGFNKLSSLHSDVGLYLALTTLDVRNNNLTDLPGDMSSLKQLREIVLSCNRFTKVPAVCYKLPKLEILLASDNKIDVIDAAGFQQLPVIATVDLQNNSISQVPPELGLCPQIKSLQLGGNLFRNPRPAIIARGTNALLEHLRSRIVS